MLTALEAAKLRQDPIARTIVEIYVEAASILQWLPIIDIPGGAYTYNVEETLPGIAFRGINETFSESTGIINPQSEALKIAGGDIDIDTAILKMFGSDQKAIQEAMKVRSLALQFFLKFIKGDSESDPREFDGLQKRLTGPQLTANGATDGGDALSIFNLDTMIASVTRPTALMMNQKMVLRLTQAARDNAVGGVIGFTVDAFGTQITTYNNLPIIVPDVDNEGNDLLGFTELGATGSTATATSIYCMSLLTEMLFGIQNGEPDVTDFGQLESKPAERTRLQWLMAIVLKHPKCAGRLYGIKDAVAVK